MPWKDRYTISDEKSLLDSEVAWPDGNRCCFRIVVDLAPACGPAGITPQDLATPDAYFGMHGGLSALTDVLRRRGLKATFAVPAVMAEIHADTIRALHGEGHEIAAHGFKHEDVSLLGRDEEKARLERTTEILARVAGQRPSGWFSLPRPSDKFAGGAVSGHTVDLLIEEGYDYFGNGLADDVPHYWVTDFASRRALLTLPYYYHFDDQFFLLFPRKGTGLENPDTLFRNWKAELDAHVRAVALSIAENAPLSLGSVKLCPTASSLSSQRTTRYRSPELARWGRNAAYFFFIAGQSAPCIFGS